MQDAQPPVISCDSSLLPNNSRHTKKRNEKNNKASADSIYKSGCSVAASRSWMEKRRRFQPESLKVWEEQQPRTGVWRVPVQREVEVPKNSCRHISNRRKPKLISESMLECLYWIEKPPKKLKTLNGKIDIFLFIIKSVTVLFFTGREKALLSKTTNRTEIKIIKHEHWAKCLQNNKFEKQNREWDEQVDGEWVSEFSVREWRSSQDCQPPENRVMK